MNEPRRGRRVVVPGLGNKLLCFFPRLLPTAILLPAIAFMQKGKAGKS
ncbi:MAG: hypothetical protein WCF20_03795 [Methylovirgula sp.]